MGAVPAVLLNKVAPPVIHHLRIVDTGESAVIALALIPATSSGVTPLGTAEGKGVVVGDLVQGLPAIVHVINGKELWYLGGGHSEQHTDSSVY